MAEGEQRYLTEGRGKLIIMNIWKTKQDRLLLLLGVPFGILFLLLAYNVVCLICGIQGESLDTAQMLSKAGVFANLLAVCVALKLLEIKVRRRHTIGLLQRSLFYALAESG